jgi:hypothetical protein
MPLIALAIADRVDGTADGQFRGPDLPGLLDLIEKNRCDAGLIPVRRRSAGEGWRDFFEFVDPSGLPDPGTLVRPRDHETPKDRAFRLAGWMSRHFWYEPDSDGPDGETHDYWKFPAETYRDRSGDCEDLAFLFAALLRLDGTTCEVALGTALTPYGSFPHAWVEVEGAILDVSSRSALFAGSTRPGAVEYVPRVRIEVPPPRSR